MTGTSGIFSLNLHATYACRHSGACCTAGWTIPVESDRQALLGGKVLQLDDHGACEFFDSGSRLCRVHRDHGEQRLPDSCGAWPPLVKSDLLFDAASYAR